MFRSCGISPEVWSEANTSSVTLRVWGLKCAPLAREPPAVAGCGRKGRDDSLRHTCRHTNVLTSVDLGER